MTEKILTRTRFLSVYTRIFLIIFSAAAVFIFGAGSFIRIFFAPDHSDHMLPRNAELYTDLLIEKMGTPPDTRLVRQLTEQTGFDVAITGPGYNFSTRYPIPDPARARGFHRLPQSDIYVKRQSAFYVRVKGPWHYIFFSERPMFAAGGSTHLLVFLALTALLFIFVFFAVRHVLSPLREINTAMRRVHDGDLEAHCPVSRNDEIGELAQTWNRMLHSLRQQIAAREQLLRDVSHELRTPLARAMLALEMMPDNDLRQSLRDDLEELGVMTGGILDGARISGSTPELSNFELIPLVAAVSREVMLQENDVIIDIPAGTELFADREHIRMLLRNLLSNARRHTPADKLPVTVAFRQGMTDCELSVTDRGEGIAAKDLPRIFDPFYRADSSRTRSSGGFGLGLYLCRAIAQAHDGTLEVQSTPGEGTTFTLTLPLRP